MKKSNILRFIQKYKLILISSLTIFLVLTLIICSVISNGKKIDFIYVSEKPSKLEFYVGEQFEYDGLEVLVTLKNGNSYLISAEEYAISGFDNSKANDMQKITITYQGFSCYYYVVINDIPSYNPKIISISLMTLPIKLSYKLGEWVDPTGGILLCEYKDGTTKEIELTLEMIFGFIDDQVGEHTLTVRYTERGTTVKTTFTVTVVE